MQKALPACPVEVTLCMIGDKWKVLILRELSEGTRRFGQLRGALAPVSQKMLTQQLRAMEESGLVRREVFAEVPPRVEYSLTEEGVSLFPVMDALKDWGSRYRARAAGQR